jgi:hypothetical protein
MKNLITPFKKSILLAAVFSTMIATANENPSTVKKEATKTSLTINVKKGNLLSVKDNNGTTLYKETINFSGTYRKAFNLTALPDGNYFFEVDKALETKTIPFRINDGNVTYNNEKETTSYKPYFNQKGNILFVSKLSPNYETATITIYSESDNTSELLFTEKVEGLQSIEKVYKLEKEKSYKIVINSDNKEYTKFINN